MQANDISPRIEASLMRVGVIKAALLRKRLWATVLKSINRLLPRKHAKTLQFVTSPSQISGQGT